MTVYVDDMHKFPMGTFGRMKMSHMVADTDEELHRMADRIGVARRWFQGDHYDISKGKRELAIQYGAVPVTLKQCSAMMMLRRFGRKGPLCKPDEAEDQIREFRRSGKGRGMKRRVAMLESSLPDDANEQDYFLLGVFA